MVSDTNFHGILIPVEFERNLVDTHV